MSSPKVVIIGGGIAGLCAGVYLRKHGFETEILEMHSIAGGLATAWKRGGYTFENCVHWLVGSENGGFLNATWKELFDIEALEFLDHEIYQVVEKGGKSLTVYLDPGRMEREFLDKAPEDAAAIKEFAGLVRKLSKMRMPEGDKFLPKLSAIFRMIPYLPAMAKYSKLTVADNAKKFKNPLLKGFFGAGLEDLSSIAIAFSLAWMAGGNAGYPVGGSLRMIGLIEDSYRKLGGKIRFRAKVERIIVADGRAAGVVLEGGEEIRAEVVVSAADGWATLFKMLEGKYVSEKFKTVYETYKPFPSYIQVSMGVGAALKNEPPMLLEFLDREMIVDPKTRTDALSFRIFNFDPTFAPAGKTAVIGLLSTYNHDYWAGLREADKPAYEAEKKRIAAEVTAVFERRFPAARGKIEVVDVATPATIIRYTGNWKGSMEGWLITPKTGIKTLPAELPGLKNFHMVGQWLSPGGGLPSGPLTARPVARRICRAFGRKWNPA
jgi:phytoene dehydrogenase-like protein